LLIIVPAKKHVSGMDCGEGVFAGGMAIKLEVIPPVQDDS
jgi:hypothetical protein